MLRLFGEIIRHFKQTDRTCPPIHNTLHEAYGAYRILGFKKSDPKYSTSANFRNSENCNSFSGATRLRMLNWCEKPYRPIIIEEFEKRRN